MIGGIIGGMIGFVSSAIVAGNTHDTREDKRELRNPSLSDYDVITRTGIGSSLIILSTTGMLAFLGFLVEKDFMWCVAQNTTNLFVDE